MTAATEAIRRVLVLPGDGIGPEVTEVGVAVLEAAARAAGIALEMRELPAGAAAIDAYGEPFPAEMASAAREADAVLLGAVGLAAPPPAGAPRPEQTIFGLRQELDAFANLRPVAPLGGLEWMSPLRPELAAELDVLLVREVTGGALAGDGGRRTAGPDGALAEDTGRYGEADVRRIVELACDLAAPREGSVTSVDKANAMATGALWREVAAGVSARRDDVRVKHMLVDAAAAGIVSDPGAFDVIVTENLFGDILSEVLGGLAGSIAVIPSASIGTGTGLFEPVHGSAPDLPARGVANPIGMIRTVAMLLDLGLGEPAPARAVEAALQRALSAGARTADIAQPGQPSLSTQGFGDAVLAHLEAGA